MACKHATRDPCEHGRVRPISKASGVKIIVLEPLQDDETHEWHLTAELFPCGDGAQYGCISCSVLSVSWGSCCET